MPEGEHAAEILFDEPAEDGIQAEWERVFDVVAEEAAVAVGEEFVAVSPIGEGAFFLDVGEEFVVLVFGVDGDPGFVEGPEEKAKLDAGADGGPQSDRGGGTYTVHDEDHFVAEDRRVAPGDATVHDARPGGDASRDLTGEFVADPALDARITVAALAALDIV